MHTQSKGKGKRDCWLEVNNESRIEIENVRVRIVICFQQVRAYNPQLEKEATYLNVAVIDTLLL